MNNLFVAAAFHGIGVGKTILALPREERRRIALVCIANWMVVSESLTSKLTKINRYSPRAAIEKVELPQNAETLAKKNYTPTFVTHVVTFDQVCKGHLLADAVAVIGTMDLVFGDKYTKSLFECIPLLTAHAQVDR